MVERNVLAVGVGRRAGEEDHTLLRLLLHSLFFLLLNFGQSCVIVSVPRCTGEEGMERDKVRRMGEGKERDKGLGGSRDGWLKGGWVGVVVLYLNFPSLSARSEDLQVRSTENLSRFTLKIRQWIVIPI